MRIGYFGGSFDPPHRGHLTVAQAARDRFQLDRVLLAPTARQPLKPDGPHASFADRLRMTELLCAGIPGLEASSIDGPQPNGEPNYTVDTLRRLHAHLANLTPPLAPQSLIPRPSTQPAFLKTPKLKTQNSTNPQPPESPQPTADPELTSAHPPDPFSCYSRRESAFPSTEPQLFAILGTDAFLTLPHWREPDQLLRLAEWIIVSRPGYPLPSLDTLGLPATQHPRIHLLNGIADPATATALRHRLQAADPCQDILPAPILAYLQSHHLYTS